MQLISSGIIFQALQPHFLGIHTHLNYYNTYTLNIHENDLKQFLK